MYTCQPVHAHAFCLLLLHTLFNKHTSLFNKQTSLFNKQTSLFNKQTSLFNKQTSLFNKQTSLFNKQTSLFNKQTSLFNKQTSLFTVNHKPQALSPYISLLLPNPGHIYSRGRGVFYSMGVIIQIHLG